MLLRMDRGDLAAGLQDLQDDTTSLQTGMMGLKLDHNEVPPRDTTHSLTGVPTSNSRLAADLGTPVIHVNEWTPPHSARVITIWVLEVTKSKYPETIYSHRNDGEITHIGLALPSPKSDSWAYKSALVKLVAVLESFLDDHSVVVRPATSDRLVLLATPPKEPQVDIDDHLNALEGPRDEVSSRKSFIPILLLLMCSFPDLYTSGVGDGNLDKARISSVLLSLVGLWPDGNPPRAALKRVNEILLGSGKS